MRTAIYRKTTPHITTSTKVTDGAEAGSDEYMVRHGYRVPTENERARYDKFTRRQGIFSVAWAWVRRRLAR
jgi:hypothetical protein